MGAGVTVRRVLSMLKSVRGPAALNRAVSEARLNKTSIAKNFVSLFPNMFKTTERNGTLYVSSSFQRPEDDEIPPDVRETDFIEFPLGATMPYIRREGRIIELPLRSTDFIEWPPDDRPLMVNERGQLVPDDRPRMVHERGQNVR